MIQDLIMLNVFIIMTVGGLFIIIKFIFEYFLDKEK
jgi:hypothetical protein